MNQSFNKHQDPTVSHYRDPSSSKILSTEQQQLDAYHMGNCLQLIGSDYNRSVDIPVAACIVNEAQEVIAASTNQAIACNDPTAHAEIAVIRKACQVQNNYRLSQCTLYVTLEPCLMCFSACMQALVDRIVFAASDFKVGVLSQALHQKIDASGNHYFYWTGGVLAHRSSEKIRDFFRINCRHKQARSEV